MGRGRVLSALTGPCPLHLGMSPQTGWGRGRGRQLSSHPPAVASLPGWYQQATSYK